MNRIPLPALDGRVALGFLAALGTLELVRSRDPHCKLSWSGEDASAVLHSATLMSIQDVVKVLASIVEEMADGVLVPGGPPGLPPAGEAPDKLRVPPEALPMLVERLKQLGSPDVIDRWISSLVTDLAVDDKGRCAHTLYGAFSGKQSMSTMLAKPLAMVREDSDYLRQALLAWERVPNVTGEYLDHRVLFDAAESSVGQSAERGVPGATWLALMSFPLIRTTSIDGRRPISTGWFRAGRRTLLRWPLWTQPLDAGAAVQLWEDPLVTQSVNERQPQAPSSATRRLAAIGVFDVVLAERRRIPGRNFAGVLAPAVWRSDDARGRRQSAR